MKYYTIGVRFPYNSRVYTYRVPEELKVKAGDTVVVSTTSGYQCVTVFRVDKEPMDTDPATQYKFITDKVNVRNSLTGELAVK